VGIRHARELLAARNLRLSSARREWETEMNETKRTAIARERDYIASLHLEENKQVPRERLSIRVSHPRVRELCKIRIDPGMR